LGGEGSCQDIVRTKKARNFLAKDEPGSFDQPDDVLEAMKQAVSQFVCGAEQSDDLTMLAILYKGA
jgi:serine phosphatase RsbU (regulator of sigma subunit)